MRPFKFRVWFKAINAMYDPQLLTSAAVNEARQNMPGLYLPFDKDTVLMQYTGLKDKNGKEIYEGDIVRYVVRSAKDEFIITATVEWKDFGFTLLEDSGASVPIVSGWTYEIIGNVFETNQLNNTSNINRSFYPTMYGMKYNLVPKDNA